ncbi:DUF2061 domain-containing protein [Candidatus Gracilibacteria bacterium]|nr:DUF2061 domain-containing protein [Candidatus Gracilibacteria bacterium]MCF7898630.1 DUF2061 domain-containing protein [Candidatus Paceibacterota bacterium]
MVSLEKSQRSIVKSVTYRLLSIAADMIAAYFFTQSAVASIGIAAVINSYSIVLYYLHERVWAHIHLGRRKIV